MHFALGHAQPGQAAGVARPLMHRQQHRFGFVAQQFHVGQRAGRDHPHHLALDRPLAGDLAHLLANCHRFAQLDEPGQVGVHRVKRHTRHHHRLPGRLAALGQGDVDEAGGFFSIGVKQLVKIAHAVKQQGVGVISFEAEILGIMGVCFSASSGAAAGMFFSLNINC
jgi:hypothetical protein